MATAPATLREGGHTNDSHDRSIGGSSSKSSGCRITVGSRGGVAAALAVAVEQEQEQEKELAAGAVAFCQ